MGENPPCFISDRNLFPLPAVFIIETEKIIGSAAYSRELSLKRISDIRTARKKS